MTDKIQQFIDEITLKSRALHHQLVEERAKNERFLKEIVGLQEDIATNKELINSQSVENASLKDINLAAKITDGMMLNIPSSIVEEFQKKISINTATVAQLQKLPHIGPAIAERIIEYRENNGNFKNLEEIMNVKGISETIYEQIKDDICL